MARLAFLERFDARDPLAQGEEPAPPPAWQEGFEAGLAQARAEAEAYEATLSAALAQTLADLSFGPAEARLLLLAQLRPLFDALLRGLLPALAQRSLVPRLIEMLMEGAERDLTIPQRMFVPTGQRAPLLAAAADLSFETFEIVEDPTLRPGEARLSAAGGETQLDLDRLVEEAGAALSALLDATDRSASHG